MTLRTTFICDGHGCNVSTIRSDHPLATIEALRQQGWLVGVVGPEYPDFLTVGTKVFCPVCAGAKVEEVKEPPPARPNVPIPSLASMRMNVEALRRSLSGEWRGNKLVGFSVVTGADDDDERCIVDTPECGPGHD